MQTDDVFYMVWSPTGTAPPKRKHYSFAEADQAAMDMARRHPSQKFVVMQAVRDYQVSDLQRTDYVEDLPF